MAPASSTAAAAVARVAALTSQAVLHVVPSSSHRATSPFAQGIPKDAKHVEAIPSVADPGAQLAYAAKQAHHDGRVASLLATAESASPLTSLVPHLDSLARRPAVLHVATRAEHADVMALRSASGLVTLYSSTATQAHDSALLAAHLAASASLPVLHFFDDALGPVEDEVTDADAASLVSRARGATAAPANKALNGASTNGDPNGVHHDDAPATPSSEEQLQASILASYAAVSALTGRVIEPYSARGAQTASDLAVVLGAGAELLAAAAAEAAAKSASDADGAAAASSSSSSNLAVVGVHLVRPFLDERLWAKVPSAVSRVAVLEQSVRRSTKLGPLFVDVAGAFQRRQDETMPSTFVSGVLGDVADENSARHALQQVEQSLSSGRSSHGFVAGLSTPPRTAAPSAPSAPVTSPKHEEAYNAILRQLFKERLAVINAPDDEADPHPAARSPEYAFGQVLAQLEQRDELERAVKDALRASSSSSPLSASLHSALSRWLSAKDEAQRDKAASEVVKELEGASSPAPSSPLARINALTSQFSGRSRWIVGSDAWAYDAGMSGVHHVLSSGRNVNLLLFDSVPYSKRNDVPAHRRKKDVGLYAMNFGNAYVASTAVYSDYTQVLHALLEADRFPGPSVVLAYVPYRTEDAPALEVLRETKQAVDSGYWPLYRWDPSAEGQDLQPPEGPNRQAFRLDSPRVRESLREFLDRRSHVSHLFNAKPELSYEVSASQGAGLRERQREKAKQAFDALVGAMDGPPLLVLYASDGGTAKKVAEKLSVRAKARGLAARLLAMDDFPVGEELPKEKNVVLVTSTAGQGEMPQNGRETFKALSAMDKGALRPAEADAEPVKYSVFAMGDSHYWPRAEDAHYYNKAGKDLDLRLEVLGAERFVPLGLGDDQDADGWQTGYKAWEPLVWKALGVDTVEVTEAEPETITNEHIKIASNYLRGTIVEGLADESTGAICETDGQLTKFHGTYMQYDRDTFDERKAAGLEPAYSFMIRCRIAGGVMTPKQWLQLDDVASQYGNDTVKITTRQTIQYHCILKRNLKAAMQGINRSLLDTIAACGDVNRNVMCSPLPSLSQLHEEVYSFSARISDYLLPRMDAYHEIWLDKGTDSKKELIAGGALRDYEPLYGPYYLPRKFKIAIAVPPRNDTDVFAHDIGLIAIADPKTGRLAGFNLSVGGGMGVTHSMQVTYPRLGDVIGFVTPEQTLEACKQVMLVQRDTGNRQNRKQARLKYTIDKHFGGPDNFRRELESRLGYKLAPAREYRFDVNTDLYGWTKDYKGMWHCGLWLENGRVRDAPGDEFRTGLRELAKFHKGHFRLTPNQHIIVSDVAPEDKARVEAHLDKWGMANWKQTKFSLSASACVAFPTCGLAMAESERALFPNFVEKLDPHIKRLGLEEEELTARMTGCPNGCARPWVAQVALVGKAPDSYLFLLGGSKAGTRVASIYKEAVSSAEAVELLVPLLERYAREREEGESFGDWVIRAGIVVAVREGARFWDHVGTTPAQSKIPIPAAA